MSHEHSIHIFNNKQKYELEHAVQTGAALKQRAGIPLSDVLFLPPSRCRRALHRRG